MTKTELSIQGDKFLINDQLTYSEIENSPHKGLLMNARFIQGVFDDYEKPERFNRFGRKFDPEKNTDELIDSLDEWYENGLRAFTVGIQGGGPCYTIDSRTIDNNPYGTDGNLLDEKYLARLARILKAADEKGMVVIVSLFYGMQTQKIASDDGVELATINISRWLKDTGYKNLIIEIANEHDTEAYEPHKVLHEENGILRLMEIAKKESGGIPVSCSGTGGYFSERIANASDIILIHGNEVTRNKFYNVILKAKAIEPKRPILVNEDSQALSQMGVCFNNGVSWGYYNNMTKQEPPVNWGITKGEDQFFALRMKASLEGKLAELPLEDQFYLQGLGKNESYEGKRFIRLASLYAEKIDYVEFYRNDEPYQQAYDDPFTINFIENWWQMPVYDIESGEKWSAKIHLVDGTILEKSVIVE